jgi:hypothetical protein
MQSVHVCISVGCRIGLGLYFAQQNMSSASLPSLSGVTVRARARALSHTLWRSESWRCGLRPHHPRNGHTLRTIRVPELNTYRVCLA